MKSRSLKLHRDILYGDYSLYTSIYTRLLGSGGGAIIKYV